MCIVLLLLTLLISIALPSVMKARMNAQIRVCKSQLTSIQQAKQRWAMENKKDSGETPQQEELVSAYLKTWPECPGGGQYTVETVDTPCKCSLGKEHAIK